MQNDRWELENLYDNPELDTVRNRLIKALKDWAVRTNETYIDTGKLVYDEALSARKPETLPSAPSITRHGRTLSVTFDAPFRLIIRDLKNRVIAGERTGSGVISHSFHPGVYVVTVQTAGRIYSKKITLF